MAEPVTATGVFINAAAMATPPAVIRVLESLGKALTKPMANFAKSTRDRAFANLRVGFQDYLNVSYNRCRYFKTILNPSQPIELTSHYVHVNLSNNKKVVEDDRLISELDKHRRVVVTGLAGSGKSMFVKYMTVRNFEGEDHEVVPLFVELRHMNGLTDRNLLTFVRVHCTSRNSRVSKEQFEISLRSGGLMLILDGFDELYHEHRDEIQRQILELTKDFPETTLVISSRPDERFGGWSSFYVYRVHPLSKEQSMRLIGTLDYDATLKNRFLRVVKDKLYDSHKSFLSSPLLTTIMLLAYEAFAEIPDKMHAFYSQAFDTLFQKHDAQKEQFQRKTYTGLTGEDFKACLAAFSAMSYLQGTYSFSESSLTKTSDAAVSYLKGADAQLFPTLTGKQFIDDLQESVCLLQQDGLDITFVHRSFQEYFAALFATIMHASKVKSLIDQFALRLGDSVISMARDMGRDTIDQEWVVPTIEKLHILLELDNKNKNLGSVFSKLIPQFDFVQYGEFEDGVAPFYERINSDPTGSLEALVHLFPESLPRTVSPFSLIVPLTLVEVRKLFLESRSSQQAQFLSLLQMGKQPDRSPHREC